MAIRPARSKAPPAPREAPRTRPNLPNVQVLSPEEAWAFFDARSRELLGMSGDEFNAAVASGEIGPRIEEPNVLDVWMIRSEKPAG